jgi:hypothetical protein
VRFAHRCYVGGSLVGGVHIPLIQDLEHALESVVCWRDTGDWYNDVTSEEVLEGIEKHGSVEDWAAYEVGLALGHRVLLVQSEVEQYGRNLLEEKAEE